MTPETINPEDTFLIEGVDGKRYRYHSEGFGTRTPEEQQQIIAQFTRAFRVQTAADKQGELEGAVAPGQDGPLGAVRAGMNEFSRNFTGGLGHYAEAAASYLPTLGDKETPMDGLSFLERRDAYRMQDDAMAEERLPGVVDDALSLAGVLSIGTGPKMSMIANPLQAGKAGATIGAIEGVGMSNAQDAEGLALDAILGTTLGGAAGAGADMLLDKVVGGTARGVFAQPGDASRRAYDAQTSLGITPSAGSIGNDLAQFTENALARAPVAAAVSRSLDPVLPGRSASLTQELQRNMVNDALRSRVTDPMRAPSGTIAADTDAELAQYVAGQATEGRTRVTDRITQLEDDFAGVTGPFTPVRPTETRGVPGGMESAGRGPTLVAAAENTLNPLRNAPNVWFDPQRATALSRRQGALEGQLGAAQNQLQSLRNAVQRGAPVDPAQIQSLQATVRGLTQQLDQTKAELDKLRAYGFQAMRDERTSVGKRIASDPEQTLAGKPAREIYEAMTNDMVRDIDLANPGAGAKFRALTDEERMLYETNSVLGKYTTNNPSTNLGKLNNAIMRGNWDDLDALTKMLTPDEISGLHGNLIESLGRTARNDKAFDMAEFAKKWGNMSDTVKQRLFQGHPDKLAIAETLAEVSRDLKARGSMDNHSNTTLTGGTMAALVGLFTNPGKAVAAIGGIAGVDRVMASEALAKAIAGDRTALGAILRQAAMVEAGRAAPQETYGRETPF